MAGSRPPVEIRTFGRVQICLAGGQPVRFPTRKALAVLVVLARHLGETVSKEKLAGLLWSARDQAHARGSLRQALNQLRKALARDGGVTLTSEGGGIRLEGNNVWADVAEFERLASSEESESSKRALELYAGPFCEDIGLDDPEFDQWLRVERNGLHDRAISLAERLLDDARRRGDTDGVIGAAQAVVRLDPTREDAHRVLVDAYAARGQRTRALQQIENCRAALSRDLDLEPEAETERLAARIRSSTDASRSAFAGESRTAGRAAAEARRFRVRFSVPTALVPVLVLAVLVVGALAWWRSEVTEFAPARVENMALSLPDRPSIAVLPIVNLSKDPAQEYLSDAVSDSIITELSRFPELFVISRNSTFTYKDKSVTSRQVAEELGVRYVVEAGLLRSNDRLRVNVRLMDAIKGEHMWAERYDREVRDIFRIQDEIVRRVVATLYGRVVRSERERVRGLRPEYLKAYEYTERGIELYDRWTEKSVREAREWLEKAIAIDPTYVRSYRWLTAAYRDGHRMGWLDMPRKDALRLARETAERALTIDPHDYNAHWAMAIVHKEEGEQRKALGELEKALQLNPNNALMLWETGDPLTFMGRYEEAISRYKEGMRLNPLHPDWWHWNLGWAQYFAGHCEDALHSIQQMKPLPNQARLELAPIYVCLGDVEEARAVIKEFRKHEPDYTLEDMRYRAGTKYDDPAVMERKFEDLRRAGFPDYASNAD